MYVGSLRFDVLLGDVHSLKTKRAIIKPIVKELAGKYAVASAQVGYLELHRRAEFAVAVVAADHRHCAEVLDACENFVAQRPEIELLSVRRVIRSDDDE